MKKLQIFLWFVLSHGLIFSQELTNLPLLTQNGGSALVDVNNDGKMDFWFQGKDQEGNFLHTFYLQTNSGFGKSIDLSMVGENMQVYWKDLDNDNLPELITLENYSLKIFTNNFPVFELKTQFTTNAGSITLADFDGNGYSDLLLYGIYKQSILYNSNLQFTPIEIRLPYFFNTQIIPFHMDGNLLPDLYLGGNDNAGNFVSQIYLNQAGQFPLYHEKQYPGEVLFDVGIHDLDGNGEPEIITTLNNQNEGTLLIIQPKQVGVEVYQEIKTLKTLKDARIFFLDITGTKNLEIALFGKDQNKLSSIEYIDWTPNQYSKQVLDTVAPYQEGFQGILYFSELGKLGVFSQIVLENGSKVNSLLFEKSKKNIDLSPYTLHTSHDNQSFEISHSEITSDLSFQILFEDLSTHQKFYFPSVGSGLPKSQTTHLTPGIYTFPDLPNGSYGISMRGIKEGIYSEFSGAESVVICPKPDLGPDLVVCEGEPVLIKNKKNFAGNWRTSTGELLGENSESLRITPIKNITLYFNYDINSGCTNSDTLSIEIQPRANPFIEKTIKVCEGDTLGLDFGNDWSQNTLYNTSYLFVQSDIRIYNYIIHESDTLIYRQVNKSGCTSKDSLIIEMTPLPEFTVSTQEFYCSDSKTEIKIETSPENTVFLEGNPVFGSVNFQIHQDSILNFTNQSPEGCLSAKSVDLHVYPRPTGILPDSLRACPGEVLQLFTESKSTVWTTVHGDTLHVGNLLSYPFQSEITIVANYPDNYGCIVVEPLLIRSKGTFDPNLSYLEICPGEIPILPSWNNVHFWKDLQTGKIFQGKDLQPPLTENRLYELSLQDLSGCTIKDTLEIRINNKIGLELPKSITFCTDQNQTLQLDNKLWSSVKWKLDTRVEEGNQLNLAKNETGKIEVSAVNLSGCRVAYTIPVFDYSDTKIILSGPKKGCIGDTVVIQASGVTVQNWHLEKGALISQDSLHFQFTIDNTTQLIASSISGGCMTADTIRIESMKLPGLDIPNTVDICENTPKWIKIDNSEYLLQWYNSNNELLSNTDSLYVVPREPETYWIESFTTEGCMKVDTLKININPSPKTETNNDKIVCGLETRLQAFYNPDYSYQWIINNEKIVGESPTLSGNLVPGNYHLIVSDSMGCFTRDTVRLFDFNSINPDKNEFLEVCKGDWINLQPLTTPLYEKLDHLFHFKWFSDEKILSNDKNLVLTVLQNQKISYQFSSEGCLSDTITYEIKISPLPTFDLDSMLVTGYQETITPNITSSENISFYWSPGLFLSSTSAKTPQITPDYSLKYQVRAKNEFGCSLSKSLQINVKNRLFIPNTFTPNEDGKNDLFKIYGNGIQSLHFIIVNEAGVPVFESTHPNQIFNEGWNGHFRGKPLKPGLYRWFIKGTFTDGSPLTYQNHTTGLIRLIR